MTNQIQKKTEFKKTSFTELLKEGTTSEQQVGNLCDQALFFSPATTMDKIKNSLWSSMCAQISSQASK